MRALSETEKILMVGGAFYEEIKRDREKHIYKSSSLDDAIMRLRLLLYLNYRKV